MALFFMFLGLSVIAQVAEPEELFDEETGQYYNLMEGVPGGFGDLLHYESVDGDGVISYLCINGEQSEKVA